MSQATCLLRGRFLALVLAFFGASLCCPALAAENLKPEKVALCLPELLKMHLQQHDMDNAFMQRLLNQFVLQLDPNKIFFLKGEEETFTAANNEELRTLAKKALKGDLTHFTKLLQAFLDTQIARDAALFDGLAARKDEVNALADEKLGVGLINLRKFYDLRPRGGLQAVMNQNDWGERALTQADREKRLLRLTAAIYKLNTRDLSENEAFKLAVEFVCDWRNKWLKIDVNAEAPKLFLKSFMNALDPHSGYFDEDEEDNFTDRLERSFAGIGVQIRPCPQGGLIEDIIQGGPADRSGKFMRGDKIIAVDDNSVAGLPIDKIVKKIKGQLGTSIKLAVVKHDTNQTEEITLKRDNIVLAKMRVKDKKIETVAGTIGLISMQSFYTDMHLDVHDKLHALSPKKPLAGVVLDLRFNKGGYFDLEEAVKLAGLFIKAGPVLGKRNGLGEVEWMYRKEEDNHEPNMEYLGPLVILVNQFSARASEVVAGTLQDYGRAVIVGATQTFGKGTLQRAIPMQKYDLPGAIQITTHQIFLAGGSSVQIKGIEPDVLIPGPKLLDEEGMLERADKNAIPWNSIKSPLLDNKAPEVKQWHEWKKKYAATLQEKSKQRVAANPEFKDAFDLKKINHEQAAENKPRLPDEPPPLADVKKEEPDLQALEAVEVVKDMLATWPKPPKKAAK
jgi:carboxyl-terminal processing protease